MRQRFTVAVAIALAAVCCGTGAHAQNGNAMCDAFVKNADGSWSAVREIAIPAAGRTYNIRSGSRFRPGAAFAGLDMVEMIEKECPGAVQAQIEQAKQVDVSVIADANGNIDVQKLTCAQLANLHQEDAALLGVWLSGWHNAQVKKPTLNVARVREGVPLIVAYCKTNGDKRVAQAIDAVLKDERR